MAIAWRVGASGYTNAGTSVSVAIPSTVAAGDLILIKVALANTTLGDPAISGGAAGGSWSVVGTGAVDDAALRTRVWSRVAVAGDAGSTVTVSWTTSGKGLVLFGAWSGTHATAPIGQVATAVEANTDATHDCPGVTPAFADSWLVEIVCDRGDAATSIEPPAGRTERVQQLGSGAGTVNGTLNDSAGTVAKDVATGVKTYTWNAAYANAVGWSIEIKAASTGTVTSGTGTARASASATRSTSRTTARTGTARASASATRSTSRTTARTATALGRATSTTSTRRTTTGTATARASTSAASVQVAAPPPPPPAADPPPTTYTVYARGADLRLTGVVAYHSLEARLVYCGVGSWVLKLNPAHPSAALLQAGTGIVVVDDLTGQVICSGPVTAIRTESDEPSGDEAATEQRTVTGLTDEHHLACRLVYPDPTQPATAQSATAYDTRSGVAETVMRALVDAHAGPGALAARRVAGLVLQADLGRGASIKTSSRFDRLSDVLTSAAVAGGLGWRVLQDGTALKLGIFVPVDRSAEIRFSREIGNLRAYSYELTGPTATRAIVAGQGEGTARAIAERGDTTAETDWSTRCERFVDRRDTADPVLLAQAGDEALAEASPTASLSLSPIDTPRIRYGQHYRLGDTVTAAVGTTPIVDVVREVRLSVDATGVRARPTVGTDGATDPATPRIYRTVTALTRRLAGLEQRR